MVHRNYLFIVFTLLLTPSVIVYCQLNVSDKREPTGGCDSPVKSETVDVGAKLVDMLASRLVAVTVAGLIM